MNKSLKYRSDIDGLRAIAVLSVIAYHAKINFATYDLFKGGFIGVDIFFVISGYLITSIIINELKKNIFSFKNFYERRARRILPAYLTVIIFSIPLAWFFILPINIIDFNKSIISGIFFTSNFYFYFSGQVYNAEGGLLIPFLHTWSLSIEEQFYIIIPLILVLYSKYIDKNLFILLFVLLLISLLFSNYAKINSSANFYFLSSRAWELLSGSLVAILKINYNGKFINKITNKFLPSIGLIFIIYSICFFNDNHNHPSFLTLIPVVGTVFIIYFFNSEGIIYKILSLKPIVGIGLISYSLYLWHYPIFAFSRITEFTQESIINKILLILLIFFLSILTYIYIETPFRNKSKIKIKNYIVIVGLTVVIAVCINLNIINNNGYVDRFPKIFQEYLIQYPYLELKNRNGEDCYSQEKNFCKFNIGKDKKIFLIGDSQMATLSKNLMEEVIKRNIEYVDMTMAGCWYLPDSYKISVKNIKTKCSSSYQNLRKKLIIDSANSIVIIGGRLPLYLSQKNFNNTEGGIEDKGKPDYFLFTNKNNNFKSQVKKTILEIAKKNKVILIYPIPEVGWHVPLKIINETRKKYIRENFLKINQELDYITTSYDVYKIRTMESFSLLDNIKHKNIFRVYPHKLFCNNKIKNRCITHDNDRVYYADDNHLSKDGSVLLNKKIIDIIDK